MQNINNNKTTHILYEIKVISEFSDTFLKSSL